MEAFFNLLWLAVSVVLAALWLFIPRSLQKKQHGSAMRIQVVALVMLILVLLPVVSLTDDLQACTAPAESEHMSRRVDLLAGPDSTSQHAVIAIASLVSFEQAVRLQTLAGVHPAHRVEKSRAGYLRHMGNLPPPLA